MNVLLTSAGRRGYLVRYFKEALDGAGQVIACNSSKDSTALMEADQWVVSPAIHSAEYVPFLVDLIHKHEIKLLISLFDVDLPVLARHRQELEESGAVVLVSDPEVVDICNDKWRTYHFLRASGIAAPLTFLATEDALVALERGQMRYPVVVKPRWGMGSLSVFIAETEEELRVFYAKSRRHIFESYLRFDSESDPGACVMLQQFVGGAEYGLDIVNDLQGRHLTTSIKQKLAMRSGETDGAITLDHPGLRALGRDLGRRLGHIGNLDADVLEQDGQYFVLELNARFGGGYPFSHLAGMDLPSEILRWCRGTPADAGRLQTRTGVVGFKAIEPRLSQLHCPV